MTHVVDSHEVEGLQSIKSFMTVPEIQATSNSTKTLTLTSSYNQVFTGSTTGQIVKLPDARTLQVGHQFMIMNESSVNIDTQLNSGTTRITLKPQTNDLSVLIDNSTQDGVWTQSVGVNFAAGKLRDPRTFSMNGTVGNNNWISVSELLPDYKYVFTEPVKLIGMEWSNGNGSGRDFDLIFYKNGILSDNIIRTYQVRNSTYDYGSATGWTETFTTGDWMRVLYIDQGDNVSDFGGRFNFEVL